MEGGARSNSGNRIRWTLLPRRGRVRFEFVLVTRCANHSLSSIDVVVVIVITVISVSVQIVMCPTREEAGMSAPRASEASVLLVNFRYYVRYYGGSSPTVQDTWQSHC